MKKLTALLLSVILCAAILASCGESKKTAETSATEAAQVEVDRTGTRVLLRDLSKNDKVMATLLNSVTGETADASIELVESTDDYNLYAAYGDADKFDRIYYTLDDVDSIQLSFNSFVSGWSNSARGVYPFTEGVEDKDVLDYALETFEFEGDEKEVYIYTPDDYDKDAEEPYPVIYMTDGQNLFERGSPSFGSWGVAESVTSMFKTSGKSAVIVGIQNPSVTRDSELTPDIGDVTTQPDTYENGKGREFSDFVANTVKPFVEKNYNVATDRERVAVCGSSSGGIESFFIGMDNPDKFGAIGAFSPAFGLFDDETWVEYLKTKDYSEYAPDIYLYCGNANDLEQSLIVGTKVMPQNLKDAGFEGKVEEHYYDKGMHNEGYWRAVYPDFLKFFLGEK